MWQGGRFCVSKGARWVHHALPTSNAWKDPSVKDYLRRRAGSETVDCIPGLNRSRAP